MFVSVIEVPHEGGKREVGANPTRSRHCTRRAGFSHVLMVNTLNDPPLVEAIDGEGEKPGKDPKVRKPASILQQSALREKENRNAPRDNSFPDLASGDSLPVSGLLEQRAFPESGRGRGLVNRHRKSS